MAVVGSGMVGTKARWNNRSTPRSSIGSGRRRRAGRDAEVPAAAPGGEPTEAFVVNFGGELHAWVNRCRHVALTMDWVENRFLDASR